MVGCSGVNSFWTKKCLKQKRNKKKQRKQRIRTEIKWVVLCGDPKVSACRKITQFGNMINLGTLVNYHLYNIVWYIRPGSFQLYQIKVLDNLPTCFPSIISANGNNAISFVTVQLLSICQLFVFFSVGIYTFQIF